MRYLQLVPVSAPKDHVTWRHVRKDGALLLCKTNKENCKAPVEAKPRRENQMTTKLEIIDVDIGIFETLGESSVSNDESKDTTRALRTS